MALRAADLRGDTRDRFGIELRRFRRSQLLGDDDAAFRHARQWRDRRSSQLLQQTIADFANIVDPGSEVGILHRTKGRADRLDLGLDSGLGVQMILDDPVCRATDESRVAQHLQIGIQQVADVLGGKLWLHLGAVLEFRAQPAELAAGADDGVTQALTLGINLRGGDTIFRHANLPIVEDERKADADTRRHTEPFDDSFFR